MKELKIENEENIILKLGEKDEENWKLIDQASQNWWWVHLNSFPSPHVIINTDKPTKSLLKIAGQFCLSNSKYKYLKDIKCCATQCNNLKKTKKIGEVEFKSNSKIIILSI